MPDIDALRIQIESNAQNAHSGLDALTKSLEKLKIATQGGAGLSNVSKQLATISRHMQNVDGTAAGKLKGIVDALKGLNGLRVNLPASVGKNLESLAGVVNRNITSNTATNLYLLATSLRRMQDVGNVRVSPALARNLTSLTLAVNGLNASGANTAMLSGLAAQLSGFSTLSAGGIRGLINQLERIPALVGSFGSVDVQGFTRNIRSLGNAFDPLSVNVSGLNRTLRSLPTQIRNLANASTVAVRANTRMGNSFGGLLGRMGIVGLSIHTLSRGIARAIKESNDYVESLNLFNASMRDYSEEAARYAETVSRVMGIDPSEWMHNLGIFQTLIEGFGVAADRAYTMSTNLTQLGYDLSSFFNIPFEDAFQKLQSGISGELEPLRRLGYDLSQVRLEAVAAQLGIDKAFSAMNQAEKAQLRYYAIMTQVTTAQGDMARTLSAPANQLRVLQAQVTQAARAIGNVFIPVLNAVLPVAIAAAKGIQVVMSAFASLFGYELPEVDYSGITGASGAVGDLEDSLDSAGGSAKELKKYLMGFDEINQIPDLTGGSGGGGSIGGGGGSDFDFSLPSYDFIGEAVSTKVDEIMGKMEPALDFIQEHAKEILTVIEGIGATLLTWKLAKAFVPDLGSAASYLQKISGLVGSLVGAAVTVGISFIFTKNFLENSEDGSIDWASLITGEVVTLLGGYISGLAATKAFGNSRAGGAVFAGTMLVSAGIEFVLNYQDATAEGWDRDNTIQSITSVLKTAMAGAVYGAKYGGGTGAAIGGLAGLVLGITAWIVIRAKAPDKGAVQLASGEAVRILKSAADIERFVQSNFDFDVNATIDLIETELNGVNEAKNELNQKITVFASSLNLIKIGVEVDKETVIPQLKDQLLGENGIIAQMQTLLTLQDNQLELAMYLAPPQKINTADSENGASSEEYARQLFEAMGLSSSVITEGVTHLGATLGELLTESMVRELTVNEQNIIDSISSTLIRIEAALSGDQATAQFYADTANINWAELDDESFENAMRKYNEALVSYRESLYEIYNGTYYQWQGRLNTLDILLEEYKILLDHAKADGNNAMAEFYEAQIDEAEKSKQNLIKQIEQFDIDATVEGRVQLVLEPVQPEIEKRFQKWGNDLAEKYNFQLINDSRITRYEVSPPNFSDDVFGFASGRSKEEMDIEQKALELASETRKAFKETFDFGNRVWSAPVEVPAPEIQVEVDEDALTPYDMYKTIQETFEQSGFFLPDNKVEELFSIDFFTSEVKTEWENAIEAFSMIFSEDEFNAMGESAMAAAREAAVFAGYEITDPIVDTMYVELMSAEMKEKLTEAFGIPIEIFKEVNEIHSPSKVFERASQDLVAGLTGPLLALPKALLPVMAVFKTSGSLLADTLIGGAVAKVDRLIDGIAQIPSMHPLSINILGYSSLMKRINAIRDGIRSITSGTARINIRATVEPESREFLLRLAKVVDGSVLSREIGEMLEIAPYAGGGLPDHGEIFIANENGPELVGRIGRQSAVANDAQIGDVILGYMERAGGGGNLDEDRLARAIARELRAAGIGAVNLDGKRLAQSINRETQRTGRNAIVIK